MNVIKWFRALWRPAPFMTERAVVPVWSALAFVLFVLFVWLVNRISTMH